MYAAIEINERTYGVYEKLAVRAGYTPNLSVLDGSILVKDTISLHNWSLVSKDEFNRKWVYVYPNPDPNRFNFVSHRRSHDSESSDLNLFPVNISKES